MDPLAPANGGRTNDELEFAAQPLPESVAMGGGVATVESRLRGLLHFALRLINPRSVCVRNACPDLGDAAADSWGPRPKRPSLIARDTAETLRLRSWGLLFG